MIKQVLKWGFLLFLIVATIIILKNHNPQTGTEVEFQETTGRIFGTNYKIVYEHNQNLCEEINKVLNDVDCSMSLFNKNSLLSKINSCETDTLDTNMKEVLKLSQFVSSETNGAFDCTVASAVNAWGFGFKNKLQITPSVIDSLLEIIGYTKIKVINDSIIQKDDARIQLDFGAIAKGYGVDKVAELLQSKGITNYMVEIGGELIAKGHNPNQKAWRIGVQNPKGSGFSKIFNVTDQAMATSGNYQNYYINEEGERVAHTIDPRTASPVAHSMLSATVVAPTCAMADAFATAFMVLGIEQAQTVLKNNPQLKAYFIYSDGDDIKDFAWNIDFDAQ